MATFSAPQNPPEWPKSVRVYKPNMQTADIEADAKATTSRLVDRHTGHFSSERYALLFTPGEYKNISVEVGYYVQVLGLGLNADDVRFSGGGGRGVFVEAMDQREGGAGSLDTFWRSAENFWQDVTGDATNTSNASNAAGLLWAVSQAAPLRRVRVTGDLQLSQPPYYASGGFAANIKVEGALKFGSQQQWITRNADITIPQAAEAEKAAAGAAASDAAAVDPLEALSGPETLRGAWSIVFAGVDGLAASTLRHSNNNSVRSGEEGYVVDGEVAYSVEETVPVVAEKPFITVRTSSSSSSEEEQLQYDLQVPLPKFGSHGSDLVGRSGGGGGGGGVRTVPFEKVFVARSAAFHPNAPRSCAKQAEREAAWQRRKQQEEEEEEEEEVGDYRDLEEEAMVTEEIQSALDSGLDVVLSPGVYHLSRALRIEHPDQVLLGLGLATLVAPDYFPTYPTYPKQEGCVVVAPRVAGVRVAGIMLQAGRTAPRKLGASSAAEAVSSQSFLNSFFDDPTSSLLEWGSSSNDDDADAAAPDLGDPSNPGVLSDVFARVGGSDIGDAAVHTLVRLRSGHVIGDNLWLWRADHTALRPGEAPRTHHTIAGATEDYHLVALGEYPAATGLEVAASATDVTMFGLAVEHTVGDLVVWKGDRGRTWFYQSELPYDVDQRAYGDRGFTAYRVVAPAREEEPIGGGVEDQDEKDKEASSNSTDSFEHEGVGVGVYGFFRDHPCVVPAAVVCPGDGKGSGNGNGNKGAKPSSSSSGGVRFRNTFTRHLNGKGTIASVINGVRGGAVGPDGPLLVHIP